MDLGSNGAGSLRPGKVDMFGCQLSKLEDDRQIIGDNLAYFRKSSTSAAPGQVTTPASDRGYLIGISLKAGHRRRIFSEHHSTLYEFDQNSIYLRNFADSYKADLSGAFGFILMELSEGDLEMLADGADASGVSELSQVVAEHDPILGGMTQALFSFADTQPHPSPLFVEQISSAIGLHLITRYGNGRIRRTDKREALSGTAATRAKDMMLSRLDGDISLDDVAARCNLSRVSFIRAFRETTGTTPSEWLAEQRLIKAYDLLRSSSLSLIEISAACGFADLTHFMRVFTAAKGTSPAAWRRATRS